jgi:biotin carboxylase
MNRRRRILLIGAGREQLIAIQIAKELGYEVAAFDGNPDAPGRFTADDFRHLNVRDPDLLVQAAKDARVDGVFVHAAELAIETARVSEALGLPGISMDSAMAATDKALRLHRFRNAGIRTPRFMTLPASASWDEWRAAGEELGTAPWVAKPTMMAGARGVERIADIAALKRYRDAHVGLDVKEFVVEQHVPGVQLSTESVMIDGQVRHTAIALRHYDTTEWLHPYLIEDGHSMPWELPAAVRAEVDSVIARSFEVLGINRGVLKGDLILGPEGVVVLEMASRTSGGRFADTVVATSTGVSILYPLMRMAMGDPVPDEDFVPTRSVGVSQRFIFAPADRDLHQLPHYAATFLSPHVVEWYLNPAFTRTRRTPKVTCHGDRIGYVICAGATREEADDRALKLLERVRVT